MKKFIELFQETLELEDREIKPEDKFRDYEDWDSLSILAVLAMINEEYNLVIPRKDFEKLNTIKDIINFIDNKWSVLLVIQITRT